MASWGSWIFGETDNLKAASGMVQQLIGDLQAAEAKVKDLQLQLESKDKEIAQLQANAYETTAYKNLYVRAQAAKQAIDLEQLQSLVQKLSTARKYLSEETMVPRPFVITGPSGVGKGTLIKKLMDAYPDKFGFSVSHTTRPPRPGEENGVHYHFVSVDEFEKIKPVMVEWAHVHGKFYGTSVQAVKDVMNKGKLCILDIDVQGARSVRETDLNPFCIFIKPPTFESLETRLRGRGTEKEEAIVERLNNAKAELAAVDEPGLFDAILVNDDLEAAYEGLKNSIAGVVGGL